MTRSIGSAMSSSGDPIEHLFSLFSRFSFATTPLDHESPPCAYTVPSTREECSSSGRLVCGSCRLVQYCSQDCQKKHWPIHKKDCKDPIRSNDWKPAWQVEGRVPTFLSENEGMFGPLSIGLSLWGNMPAINILNMSPEEIALRPNIDLAFVASGDLRNIIHTINGIPLDYGGTVNAVLNDRDPYVTLRNIMILRILGTISDKKRAVDMALHLWYSAFIPRDYWTTYVGNNTSILMDFGAEGVKLGAYSTLVTHIGDSVKRLCSWIGSSDDDYDYEDARKSYYEMRFNPSRVDYQQSRRFLPLKPSHRLAHLKYFKSGVLLPFGAHDETFDAPNRFLFGPQGQWVQADFATPVDGWCIEDVIPSGKAHGAKAEDVFGCLYYHVLDQLYSFVDRLSCLKISIKIVNDDTLDLAKGIKKNQLAAIGIDSQSRFDRIEVSNIMDLEYVGIRKTLDAWGSLLKETKDATLVGYFMNWTQHQRDGEPRTPKALPKSVMKRLMNEGRFSSLSSTPPSTAGMMEWMGQMTSVMDDLCSGYDNSRQFDTFLTKNGLGPALKSNKLKRKPRHSIVPHRLCVPLDAPPSAIPEFGKDSEGWYLQSTIGGPTWYERFIEIGRDC